MKRVVGMAEIDPLTRAEDDKILTEFAFSYMMEYPRRNRGSIFSKIKQLDEKTLLTIHDQWNMSNQEKATVIQWHRDHAGGTNKDYIYLIVEAAESGLLEQVLEILEYDYREGLALTISEIEDTLEFHFTQGIPLEWCVQMHTGKSSEDIQRELEESKERRRQKEKVLESQKITLEKLQDKWQS